MPLSNSLAAYTDCFNIWKRVLQVNGGSLIVDNMKAAHRWRIRLHHSRKLLESAEKKRQGKGFKGIPHYNYMVQVGDEQSDGKVTITFKLRSTMPTDAVFVDPSGKAIYTPLTDEELTDEAEAIKALFEDDDIDTLE